MTPKTAKRYAQIDELVLASLLAGDTTVTACKRVGLNPAVTPSSYFEALVAGVRGDGVVCGVYKSADRAFDVGLTYALITGQLDLSRCTQFVREWAQLWQEQ